MELARPLKTGSNIWVIKMVEIEKIVLLKRAAEISAELRASGKSIVLCHGTFDLMHAGHIKYLQKAKSQGDILFVTVTADEYVNKGPGRPVFDEKIRAENLAALSCVDYVAVNHDFSSVELLKKIKPRPDIINA